MKLAGSRHPSYENRSHFYGIASRLMRYGDQTGNDWADIIDFLTMHPGARRRVVRVLAEIDASSG